MHACNACAALSVISNFLRRCTNVVPRANAKANETRNCDHVCACIPARNYIIPIPNSIFESASSQICRIVSSRHWRGVRPQCSREQMASYCLECIEIRTRHAPIVLAFLPISILDLRCCCCSFCCRLTAPAPAAAAAAAAARLYCVFVFNTNSYILYNLADACRHALVTGGCCRHKRTHFPIVFVVFIAPSVYDSAHNYGRIFAPLVVRVTCTVRRPISSYVYFTVLPYIHTILYIYARL